MTQRRFANLAMYAGYSAPESVPRSTLHSTQIPAEANGWAGQNYPGYVSERMDRLLDAIEVELDRPRPHAFTVARILGKRRGRQRLGGGQPGTIMRAGGSGAGKIHQAQNAPILRR